jgi:exosortase
MTQEATLDYRTPLTAAAEPEQEATYYGLTLSAWLKIGIVSVLMIATFRFNLLRLWLKTNPFSGEPNWRHAVCVPLIGLYYLYVHRDDLLKIPVQTAWSGLGILVFGIILFAYGIYPGQNDFIKDFGMVVALFGVVALLCGWKMMKIAWFPVVFLVCAIPWPELMYSKIASPLQHLAASIAVGTLRLFNVEALNSGTKIIMVHTNNEVRTLNVAEACAGLRSLMTFISVGAAIAFLSARPLWQKIVLTFSAIPIAVLCNVMRVTGQGFLDMRNHELSQGFAHQFAGVVMLIPGFFMLLLVGWMMDQIFIEVADESTAYRRKAKRVEASGAGANWTLPRAGPTGQEAAVTTTTTTTTTTNRSLATSTATSAATATATASKPAPVAKPAAAPAPAARPAAAAASAPTAAPARPAPAKPSTTTVIPRTGPTAAAAPTTAARPVARPPATAPAGGVRPAAPARPVVPAKPAAATAAPAGTARSQAVPATKPQQQQQVAKPQAPVKPPAPAPRPTQEGHGS